MAGGGLLAARPVRRTVSSHRAGAPGRRLHVPARPTTTLLAPATGTSHAGVTPARRCAPVEPVVTTSSPRIRRRRLTLVAVTAALLVALALPWGGSGGHSLATPGPVLAGATVSHHALYIVQPGDTMWSIAERLDPTGDPRAVVSALEAQVGSDDLQPGQQLRLP